VKVKELGAQELVLNNEKWVKNNHLRLDDILREEQKGLCQGEAPLLRELLGQQEALEQGKKAK
tara:strand:+ start:18 stop:206 length:189 start_codon:yes stop_codon:yes gene_type:complete